MCLAQCYIEQIHKLNESITETFKGLSRMLSREYDMSNFRLNCHHLSLRPILAAPFAYKYDLDNQNLWQVQQKIDILIMHLFAPFFCWCGAYNNKGKADFFYFPPYVILPSTDFGFELNRKGEI